MIPYLVSGLLIYFFSCVAFIAWATPSLTNDNQSLSILFSTGSTFHRWDAWILFIDAISQRPWFGYGFNQSALAQMEVAVNHPNLFGVFTFAHNIFLDLIIWCGIPIGIALIGFIILWLFKNLNQVSNPENALLMMMLLVVGNHAMFEMPLYYAYFLLQIKVKPMGTPDVVLLSQWYDQIDIARFEPNKSMSDEDLKRMEDVIGLYPNPLLAHKAATAFALNNQSFKARLWLQRLCKISPEEQCKTVETIWAKQSLKYPEIAAIPWPVKNSSD